MQHNHRQGGHRLAVVEQGLSCTIHQNLASTQHRLAVLWDENVSSLDTEAVLIAEGAE